MAHAKETRTNMQRSANSLDVANMPADAEGWKAGRRISKEQEQADFAAWLREYRRWTQSGCCADPRVGEIEWGAETCDRVKA